MRRFGLMIAFKETVGRLRQWTFNSLGSARVSQLMEIETVKPPCCTRPTLTIDIYNLPFPDLRISQPNEDDLWF